ncbi:hypothetical protein [Tuwongella immobilis]|uniref:Uncharacterized protein n=1 Tax=Tuwongella immobilis TaxID=692036 RepID=A0A6C2YNF8_9BACT|nr:hypothetical protein [Tuwongella immobilis]VIP02821.1 unnamed protein product [Tuwongella immobilis]VTS02551.1 unnamed protein product [Tuwongella immobilis]
MQPNHPEDGPIIPPNGTKKSASGTAISRKSQILAGQQLARCRSSVYNGTILGLAKWSCMQCLQ